MSPVTMLRPQDGPLVVAVPSKGRLQENASAFFARAGLAFQQGRGARDYRGAIAGLGDVVVEFLSASEITRRLGSGEAHLGITGEDLVREEIADPDAAVALLTPLGFGHANVVVAAPQAWIDVRTMADLEEVAVDMRVRHGRKMRVATKYVQLTRRFFAERGLADYRIVESLGATEGAPASGAAEIVVDITTTGATLAANALKVIEDGVILRSEANLVASLRAPWGARARTAVRAILGRIAAEEAARTTREVRARIAPGTESAFATLAERAGARAPYGASAPELVLHVPRAAVFALVDGLAEAGASEIGVRALEYLFRAENPLLATLEERLAER